MTAPADRVARMAVSYSQGQRGSRGARMAVSYSQGQRGSRGAVRCSQGQRGGC